ncbi:hypothetical protein Tco_0383142, partial [Tanacetum coccineum]
VMAAPIISILSESSEESVDSQAPLVILFGAIPAIIPEVPIVPADPIITPEAGIVSVVSPTGVLELVDYSSSSDSDLSKDSLPPVPELPLVSPFLFSDESEADGEFEPTEQRLERHESLTPSYEFPLTPVVASPGICRRPAILVRPSEAIPFGRPYRTHLNRPRKLLTARKRDGPFPARRLAWRRVSHHLSDRHSSADSSSSSSPLDHSLSGHTPPDTTDADTSTPPRFSSLGSSFERSLDSSSPSSEPSRKRCRSSTALVPSPNHVSRSIVPTPTDLLPPRKRFRDSYSLEDSREAHIEVDTTDAEAVADVGISDGVVAHTKDGVGMRVEIAASDVRDDDEEFKAEANVTDMTDIVVDPLAIGDSSESSRGGIPNLEDTIFDLVHYMSEVYIDRITMIETTQRQLEASQLVASGERASLVERIGSLRLKDRDDTRRRLRRLESTMTITRFGMTPKAIEELVNRRVEEELADHELMKLMAKVYCPRNEIQKMESELWNLTVKNNDLAAYNRRFQEFITMMCTKMVPEEEDRVEKFIGELPDKIQGNVIVVEPTRLQDIVRIANNLLSKGLRDKL